MNRLLAVFALFSILLPMSFSAEKAMVSLPQAPGVIEVIPTGQWGQSFSVHFRSIGSVPTGTNFSFRIITSNGDTINLRGFTKTSNDDGGIYWEMWNGPFPNVWPGWSTFETFVTTPGDGISYTSALVPVQCMNCTTGLLERADVSPDGASIKLGGYFPGRTYATLNGLRVEFLPVPPGADSLFSRIISTENAGSGKMDLTVCSDGICSTRTVYVTRSVPTLPSVPGKG